MNGLEAQVARELERILAIVTELTGLPSNWSGRLELIAQAEFKGRKSFSCDIQLDQALARLPGRWTTLIHEALHAVSVGYVGTDYRSFPGWEEGAVEKLQRLLRTMILDRMGIDVEVALFEQVDADHLYNSYVDALEELRAPLGVPEERFYLDLLRTPLGARPAFVFGSGNRLKGRDRTKFMRLFSTANSVLRGILHSEPKRLDDRGEDGNDGTG